MTPRPFPRQLALGLGLGLAILLAACSDRAREPAEPAEEAQVAPAPEAAAPAVPPAPAPPETDIANAEQFVTDEGDRLEALAFPPQGSLTVDGEADGYVAPVYAVPVAAGQTLTVTLESASANIYFNVSDAVDHSGAALFGGEMDGKTATLTAERDMTYVVTPFQPRASARRGEVAPYRLTVARN